MTIQRIYKKENQINLLKIKPVWVIVKSTYYPIVPQLITLSVFVVLFIGSIGVGYDPELAPYIASTNLANQVVWNIWWPFTLVVAAIACRLWCSVCPLGSILGMYSYIAGTEWRADDPAIRKECKTKDCVAKRNRYKLAGHSCTSNLNPANIPDNRQCLLCTHCLKACPSTNFRFSLRLPFTDFFKNIKLSPAEMGILILMIGFVNNNWPVYKLNFLDPLGVRTATLLAENSMVIDRSGLGPAWSMLGTTSWLLYGIVFAVSVVIILKSPLTESINRTGKLFLILSVASYIASFYIKI